MDPTLALGQNGIHLFSDISFTVVCGYQHRDHVCFPCASRLQPNTASAFFIADSITLSIS